MREKEIRTQKKKIVKNETRWGQIMCSGKNPSSFTELQKEKRLCVCLHIIIAPMEEKFFFYVFFFIIIYFGFFPLGSIIIKV